MIFVLLFSTFLFAVFLTQLIRSYALNNLLDIPNQRSSHHVPTPRGGGLAIVIAYFSFLAGIFFLELVALEPILIVTTSLAVVVIGFWDDHQHIAARWRFLTHAVTAAVALILLSMWATSPINLWFFDDSWLAYVAVWFFLVWSLNLFNFMDGIDGIAGSETVFVSISLAGFMYFVDVHLALLALGLAFSCLGFLVWNWPPAKIFMGDVGSGFLGYTLAVLILVCAQKDPVLIVIGLILFAVFIADATYTLAHRILDRQEWYQAHCSHAYQFAAKQKGHRYVLVAVGLINLFWLLPIAILVFRYPQYAGLGLSMAYAPLVYVIYRIGAGKQVGN
ncbi:MAG: glycosyl transferase [Methyloprofundus sp.]|nr:glycosyl transferase [Methyloprofundus sp.]